MQKANKLFRQMREFQSAGPSSALNSARGSTHGSLGSNLHQVSLGISSLPQGDFELTKSQNYQFKAGEIAKWSRSLSKIRLKYVRPRLN